MEHDLIDAGEIRDRAAEIARRPRHHRAQEADLIYQAIATNSSCGCLSGCLTQTVPSGAHLQARLRVPPAQRLSRCHRRGVGRAAAARQRGVGHGRGSRRGLPRGIPRAGSPRLAPLSLCPPPPRTTTTSSRSGTLSPPRLNPITLPTKPGASFDSPVTISTATDEHRETPVAHRALRRPRRCRSSASGERRTRCLPVDERYRVVRATINACAMRDVSACLRCLLPYPEVDPPCRYLRRAGP